MENDDERQWRANLNAIHGPFWKFHRELFRSYDPPVSPKTMRSDGMTPNSHAYRDAFARIRAAIKSELVDESIAYPKGWHGGWLSPASEQAADSLLDDIACMATRAAFGIETDE